MDDLGAAVSSILSDPGAMEQINLLAKQLGLSQDAKPEEPERPPNMEALLPEGLSPEKLGKILTAVRTGNEPDDATRFLEALRPMLRREMQGKLDRAQRAIRLMHTAKAVSGVWEL